ncbi:MAG: FkbM family methyltransferase [Candidatus Hadarchaeum sp.]
MGVLKRLHENARVIGLRRSIWHGMARRLGRQHLTCIKIFGQPFYLRLGGADPKVLVEVFLRGIYQIPLRNKENLTIVDAGAHIGVAAVFFANRFMPVRIISIEPTPQNTWLLELNTRFYSCIHLIGAALWWRSGLLQVADHGSGSSGFRVGEAANGRANVRVPAVTVDDILEEFDLERIDLLKCDIEGAEREVFEHADSWIHRVDVVAVEVHDRFKQGCKRAVAEACRDFTERLWLGSTWVLGRPGTLEIAG